MNTTVFSHFTVLRLVRIWSITTAKSAAADIDNK